MTRLRSAWLLSVPLIVAGVEAGHWLTFRLVYPDPYERRLVLASSGHGYLSHWLDLVAVLAALALVGFVVRIRGQRGSHRATASLTPFLALAPLAFALQECGERLATGGWPLSAALEPTFLPGIAIQIPVAAATFLLARALLRVADEIRVRLLPEAPRLLPLPAHGILRLSCLSVPPLTELRSGFGVRGPPAALARA